MAINDRIWDRINSQSKQSLLEPKSQKFNFDGYCAGELRVDTSHLTMCRVG
jgi:hypothetical protein